MPREMPDGLKQGLGAAAQAQQSAVDALDEAAATSLGVNRTDLRCLEVLLACEATTPSGLGIALGLTTGSVTAMLDRLQRLGYLTRSPDPGDRRKVVVRITPEAARRAYEIYGPIAEEGTGFLSAYTVEELRLITGFLRRSRELYERHLTRVRDLPGTAPSRRG
ncbi:MarR family winged helix-turn-helix transcriptional regulator [Sphaerisporangium corydalis]|uniref:MarR family winged helix-turn-helix transcriptional regulator n=1 Tax=Sphaerisporangium corydalis TaxID=1441875 RepID=A0ABV9EN03_9ACTN|nr:MarR family transcriptional regulator [Sphaerisporangium corydalis]